jgi:hypothetical protein
LLLLLQVCHRQLLVLLVWQNQQQQLLPLLLLHVWRNWKCLFRQQRLHLLDHSPLCASAQPHFLPHPPLDLP